MDSVGISASGMRAASLRLEAAASNVARLPIAGAPRVAVAASGASDGGVSAQIVAAGPDTGAPTSNLVEARSAVLAFDANAQALRASDQALGFLLDVTA